MIKNVTKDIKNHILYLFRNCDLNESELLNRDNFYEKIIEKLDDKHSIVDYFHGVSKCVFFLKEYPDLVVKIPFNGGLDPASYSYKNSPYVSYDDFYWSESPIFCCADNAIVNCKGLKRNWDYCEVEEILFKRSCCAGVNDYFAQTICIGEINDYPIYIQEKATILSDSDIDFKYPYKVVKETKEQIKNIINEDIKDTIDRLPMEWIYDFYTKYGKELLIKLMSFIAEEEISDLHCDNVGFINDRPVLTDYSSFWS